MCPAAAEILRCSYARRGLAQSTCYGQFLKRLAAAILGIQTSSNGTPVRKNTRAAFGTAICRGSGS